MRDIQLKPIGTIFYEYFMVGNKGNAFADEPDEVHTVKVTLKVVGHGLTALGQPAHVIEEVAREYVD